MADLDSRVAQPANDYELLRASGLVRMLLTDAEPLARKVTELNQVRFRVHRPTCTLSVAKSNDFTNGPSGGLFLGHLISPHDPTNSDHLDLDSSSRTMQRPQVGPATCP